MDNNTDLNATLEAIATLSKICEEPSIYIYNMNGSLLEKVFFMYLFPILGLTGVVGNSLNILVLRDKGMKRTYILFFWVALSDILFFFSLSPTWLASYNFLAQINSFRQIFYAIKIHFLGLANWISAFNIWTVCLISLERYSAVNNPMKQNKMFGFSPKIVVATFMFLTFICTSYFHYESVCKTKFVCNGTWVLQACMDVRSEWEKWENNTPQWLRTTVEVLRYIHGLVAIFLPMLLVIGFNIALIYHAKSVGFSFQGSVSKTNHQRTENRITQIAIVIIFVFFVSNFPSAIVLLYQTVHPIEKSHNSPGEVSIGDWAKLITSILTMSGKAVNFFIFCIYSENFRRRLKSKICCGYFASITSSIDDSRRRSKRFNL
ncbi:hypothetical protein PRIPAC_93064 [Pristionchus pacificus]|nr:hypothetical protein PRIPAC_93064 [Pristionchus pacificus]|eukprot:PDM62771.1 G protein-coupled receptor [Pristionchus pacificus]